MVYTPSSQLLILIAFLVAVLVQTVSAQEYDEWQEASQTLGDDEKCPNESMIHYQNCRGELKQCSTCLGDAEIACERERKQQGKSQMACFYCTKEFSGRCDSAKPMCFGKQDCGDGLSCINFSCVYDG